MLGEAAPGCRVYVQGHTDAGPSEVQAQRRSELKAEAVRSVLVQHGVEPGRVHAIGYGAARPVQGDGTEAGRRLDRRAEIVVGECGFQR